LQSFDKIFGCSEVADGVIFEFPNALDNVRCITKPANTKSKFHVYRLQAKMRLNVAA
jgi:hypothetical protein